MKLLIVVLAVAAVVFAAEEQSKDETTERPKTFRRLIPADVLRDFPGMCFASTRCATVSPGEAWDLAPFCGRSTCVASEDNPPRLLELVEDCGPSPKANPDCSLSPETNKTAPFPECCPKFTCKPGASLKYPEIETIRPPTPEEIAEAEKAAAAESTTVKA